MTDYEILSAHCTSLGVRLMTTQNSYDTMPETPRCRPMAVQLGCIHQCATTKLAWQLLDTKNGDCPMCADGIDVVMEIIETQLMERHLTLDHIRAMNEDHPTIACLYAKTKHAPGTIVSDMIELWLKQDGKCARCKCMLFPTLSTRSVVLQRNKFVCSNC